MLMEFVFVLKSAVWIFFSEKILINDYCFHQTWFPLPKRSPLQLSAAAY